MFYFWSDVDEDKPLRVMANRAVEGRKGKSTSKSCSTDKPVKQKLPKNLEELQTAVEDFEERGSTFDFVQTKCTCT